MKKITRSAWAVALIDHEANGDESSGLSIKYDCNLPANLLIPKVKFDEIQELQPSKFEEQGKFLVPSLAGIEEKSFALCLLL